jgi:hypothetical protein
MPDDKSKRGKPDRSRTSITEPYEAKRWAKKFGVTTTKLKSLVRKHGPSVKRIRKATLGK